MAPDLEQRNDDRGRNARRMDLKAWLQISSLILACAAIVWQGGKLTEKLDNVASSVQGIEVSVAQVRRDVEETRGTARVLEVKVSGHEKELGLHETRINRIETRRQ